MRPPKHQPPVCCELHTHRYLPIPETDDEKTAVTAAERRWDEEFWLVGDSDDGRDSTEDLPDYVKALMPDDR